MNFLWKKPSLEKLAHYPNVGESTTCLGRLFQQCLEIIPGEQGISDQGQIKHILRGMQVPPRDRSRDQVASRGPFQPAFPSMVLSIPQVSTSTTTPWCQQLLSALRQSAPGGQTSATHLPALLELGSEEVRCLSKKSSCYY